MKHWTRDFDLASIPDDVLQSEYARRQSLKRQTFAGGRPKVLRPCPHCRKLFGSAELRRHVCPKKLRPVA